MKRSREREMTARVGGARLRLGILSSTAAVALMLTGGAAAAQAVAAPEAAEPAELPAPAEPPAAADSGGLAEVVVTAQRREENLQDVPVAVTAIGQEALEDLHIQDIRGITGTTPNVSFGQIPNSRGPTLFIRGIGQVEGDPFGATAVGLVIDGVVQGALSLGLR